MPLQRKETSDTGPPYRTTVGGTDQSPETPVCTAAVDVTGTNMLERQWTFAQKRRETPGLWSASCCCCWHEIYVSRHGFGTILSSSLTFFWPSAKRGYTRSLLAFFTSAVRPNRTVINWLKVRSAMLFVSMTFEDWRPQQTVFKKGGILGCGSNYQ